MNETTIVGFVVALGAGLLIGIDRERRKGSGPARAFAGVRTFALAALTGALAQALAQPWLLALGAIFIATLALISHWRERGDPGATTELALFLTYLLGVCAIQYPAFAAGGAVVVALLLASRKYMHTVSVRLISTTELHDGLLLAGAALVILPLLPNQPIEFLAGLNPRRLWGLVVLFMAIQAGSYIATRILGARVGFSLSGLASGFISSTATVASMGARARREPELHAACVAGALFSVIATPTQMALIALVIYPPALPLLGPSLLAAVLVAAAIAAASFWRLRSIKVDANVSGRMFNVWHAVAFAALLSVAIAVVGIAAGYFGEAAVDAGAALAGFFDAHAAGTSVLALAASGRLAGGHVLFPVLLGLTTNTLSRLAVAFSAGGAAYASRVSVGLVAVVIAAWLPYFFISR